MGKSKKILCRAMLAIALVAGVSMINSSYAKSQGSAFENIAAPNEQGQYNVGIRTFFNVPLNGVPPASATLTAIQVYYPTLALPDCESRYTIQGVGGGFFERSSPLCGVQNAPAAPGTFPLVVHDHGGGGPGVDSQRISQLPVHETLASHGFVVVSFRHAATANARVRDLPLVIDHMLTANPLANSIDPERIGISGFSTGGRTSLAVTGGWAANGLTADPRIKAMVLYEPGRDNSLEDVSNISFPYLMIGGNRNVNGVVVIPEVFDATVAALPRIHVLIPEALHFNHQTDLCGAIEETREAAIVADPTLAEPLTNMTMTTPPRTCNTNIVIDPTITDLNTRANIRAASVQACTYWNQAELVQNLGAAAFAFGGGRNICNRVGTVDSTRPLDTHPTDGITDSYLGGDPLIPLFEPNDAYNSTPSTVETPIPAEIMVPMMKLYTVAYFKKFLEGDGRYMRYLTPGYANTQNLQAIVEIRE